MRLVICINPRVPLEHHVEGRKYAEASIGFDYSGAIDDKAALAAHLREAADALAAPAIHDNDLQGPCPECKDDGYIEDVDIESRSIALWPCSCRRGREYAARIAKEN
jgi:hypothetical protein